MQPIHYTSTLYTRFSDLDPYGHVNSSKYLDFVISSRWIFSKEEFGVSALDVEGTGIGFFLANSDIHYLKPVIGPCRIDIDSHVIDIDESKLKVAFEIRGPDQKRACVGTLKFVILDLATMKRQTLPDQFRKYFFFDSDKKHDKKNS